MTQAPQQEVEVHGLVGEPVTLPVGNDGATAYRWSLELPDDVEAAPDAADGRLRVTGRRAGSHVLVATLADPAASTPMTVLQVRLTVS